MAITQLSRGMSGSAVMQLQNDLLALGFKLPVYGADGQFGSETEQAVRDFQYTYGVQVDGIVGPLTAAAIKEAINLLNQGQWNPSIDPLKAPSSMSVPIVNTQAPVTYQTPTIRGITSPEYPSESRYVAQYQQQQLAQAQQAGMLQLPVIGNIPWTWIALGGLGLLVFLFIRRRGNPLGIGRRRRIRNEPD